MSLWLTARECVNLPGLPGREHNIRIKLNKFAEGNSSLVRKRAGSKAFEFHIDCLPEVAQQALRARQIKELMNGSPKELPAAPVGSSLTPRAKGTE
ncbi:DNA-binding protein, partial [Klebsiella pneumoniae]